MRKFYNVLAGIPALMAMGTMCAYAQDVVTEAKGETVVYSRSSVSVRPMGDSAADTEEYGFAGIMVFGDDGKVYLRNPFSQFLTDSYLVGTKENGEIRVELPQQVMVFEEDGESYDLFACMLTLGEADEELNIATSDNQTLIFRESDGGWVMDNGEDMLGMTFDDSSWTGFGEMGMVYAPLKETTPEVPDGLKYERWMLTYGMEGHYVDMAIDGDKCYLKNFLPTSEKSLSPMVGEVTATGIRFASPQYLGVNEDNSYLTYFYGGEVAYMDGYHDSYTVFFPEEEIVFEIQPDGSYTCSSSAIFTPFSDIRNEYFWYEEVFENMSLKKGNVADPVPANPSVVDYRYYPTYEFGFVSFDIPMLNAAGEILNTKNLYYNVYLDGEMLEFSPDEYPLLTEPMTDIPYDFQDGTGNNGDIKIEGSKHTIILYREGLEEVGVQSYYLAENGEKYYSELVLSFTSGISTTAGDGLNVSKVEYLDMNGRKTSPDAKGVMVQMTTFSDGTVNVRKLVRK